MAPTSRAVLLLVLLAPISGWPASPSSRPKLPTGPSAPEGLDASQMASELAGVLSSPVYFDGGPAELKKHFKKMARLEEKKGSSPRVLEGENYGNGITVAAGYLSNDDGGGLSSLRITLERGDAREIRPELVRHLTPRLGAAEAIDGTLHWTIARDWALSISMDTDDTMLIRLMNSAFNEAAP